VFRISDRDEIVERISRPEKRTSLCLAASERQEAFFNGWTRKEACLKAIAVGLNQPPNTVEVSFEPGKPARLLRIEENPQKAAAWSLYELSLGTDYVGALAVKGCHGLRLWEWEQLRD
jgi:4'-phosphopantetheinyl transferase